MRGIIYVSKASIEFDNPSLDELAARAAARNAELKVTGYLYFEKGRFIQYIEGETQPVTELMDRIEKDSRHAVISRIHEDDVPSRRFPSWHMRRLTRGEIVEIKLEHILSDYLVAMKPFATGSDSVWRMVQRIADMQSRLSKPAA